MLERGARAPACARARILFLFLMCQTNSSCCLGIIAQVAVGHAFILKQSQEIITSISGIYLFHLKPDIKILPCGRLPT